MFYVHRRITVKRKEKSFRGLEDPCKIFRVVLTVKNLNDIRTAWDFRVRIFSKTLSGRRLDC